MATANPLILLVDDTEDVRDIWRRVLLKAGFRIAEAVDGEDGVRKARDERPDLVVMDMSMPVLSGVEASRQLKGDSRTAAVPIIVVSADADAEADARAVGCDGFLLKPASHRDLISHIRRLLTEAETRLTPVAGG